MYIAIVPLCNNTVKLLDPNDMKLNLKIATALGLSAFVPALYSQQRPNIIYIMSDDHAYQALSAYGGPLKDLAPTPNIDRIAASGMRFNRCLVTNSISGPCRAVILTGKSIKWLKEVKDSGKPFMLMMHHKAPHREWWPGPNELALYKGVTFPEPATLFDDYSDRGTAEKTQDMTISKTMRIEEDLKMYSDRSKMKTTGLNRMNPEQSKAWDAVYDPIIRHFYESNLSGKDLIRFKYQRYLQDYLACIAAVDKSVGEVLDYLKENGLDKNTIVIYASDQGFYMEEHGWFDKRWMFEQSYRTPLLIKWAGVIKPGSVNEDYDIDEWELFDIKADPEEMKNVYNEPAYASIKEDLHKRLTKIMAKYKDSEALAHSFLPGK